MSSKNSSGSISYQKFNIKKLQKVHLYSMPDLNSNQRRQEEQIPENLDMSQKQNIFYEKELKKRDDIVLFLCEKMQGMESQIDMLRGEYNKSKDNHKKHCPSPIDSDQLNVNMDNSKDFIRYISSILKPGSNSQLDDATISSGNQILHEMIKN